MEQAAYISTREAAERLKVHARTIRKWIDTFEEYIVPDLNEKGHYTLTEESYSRLVDIQNRLHETQKPMREIKDDLVREGLIESLPASDNSYYSTVTTEVFHDMTDSISHVIQKVDELFGRIERLEDQLFGLSDCMYEMEHQFITMKNQSISSKEIHRMFEEIRKKQDILKVQLRNVGYASRFTAAASEESFEPRKQKHSRVLGIF